MRERVCESWLRGEGGERERGGRAGRKEKRDVASRRTGEPEFAQEAMKYVTGMMDVSA